MYTISLFQQTKILPRIGNGRRIGCECLVWRLFECCCRRVFNTMSAVATASKWVSVWWVSAYSGGCVVSACRWSACLLVCCCLLCYFLSIVVVRCAPMWGTLLYFDRHSAYSIFRNCCFTNSIFRGIAMNGNDFVENRLISIGIAIIMIIIFCMWIVINVASCRTKHGQYE